LLKERGGPAGSGILEGNLIANHLHDTQGVDFVPRGNPVHFSAKLDQRLAITIASGKAQQSHFRTLSGHCFRFFFHRLFHHEQLLRNLRHAKQVR
jgi:hypothetical protein